MRASSLLVLLLFLVLAVFARHKYVCDYRGLCDEPVTEIETDVKTVAAANLSLMKGKESMLEGFNQFMFDENSATINLTDNNTDFLKAVKSYLIENPGQNITITGAHLASEADTKIGSFDNIGIARAAAIRDALIEYGIDGNRFKLDSKLSDDLSQGAWFDLFEVEEKEANAKGDEEAAAPEYTFKNMSFDDNNFAYNSAEFSPNSAFIKHADEVVPYLKENSDKKLTLVGHTDNRGTDSYNMKLGLDRAKSVRSYFQKKGISARRISVKSEGESKPRDKAETEEAWAKNRRVDVLIK